jgi:hypothetical protein
LLITTTTTGRIQDWITTRRKNALLKWTEKSTPGQCWADWYIIITESNNGEGIDAKFQGRTMLFL